MPKVTIICDVDTYRLSVGKIESDDSEYGDPCFLDAGSKSYMALVCEDDQGTRYSLLSGDDWVVEVRKSIDYEFEDVAGDGDEPESDETEPDTDADTDSESDLDPELENDDDDDTTGDDEDADNDADDEDDQN